ncbi:MAG: hypothetical protein ACT4QF_03810 [Sporichthyaceae bacterium]
MISSVLSKRRSIPVIVRRDDADFGGVGDGRSRGGRPSRRAPRRRGLFRGDTTRSGWVAVTVLVSAAIAWILTFAYLASLG